MKPISIALVAVLLLPAVALAVEFPDTRPGEIAREYFAAFNSGEEAKIRAFISNYRSADALAKRDVDARVPRVLGFRNQLGAIEIGAITGETANTISVAGRSTNMDMWLAIKFTLEEAPPHKLFEVQIGPGSPPDMAPAAAAEWSTLQELIAQFTSENIPGIAAAIIEGGKVVDLAVVGVRMSGADAPVQKGDRFHAGSVTKSMTATMIAALVESGTLRWDLTVAEALPGSEMRDEYRGVTLEQLLNHLGGFQPWAMVSDEDEARFTQGTDPVSQRATFVTALLMEAPANPAGEYNYSNAGYTLAAHMAERAAGSSWEALMREHLFDPLGMAGAGFGWPANPGNPDAPRGHQREGGALVVQPLDAPGIGAFLAPAGDVNCSVAGLAAFAVAHLQGMLGQDGVLTATTVERLHTPGATNGADYVAGWAVVQREGVGEVHWHAGSAGTFYALVELYPGQNRAVVVMMNVGPEGSEAANRIAEAVATGPTPK
jgi:CubicO group peptidase (beta-lactamase class C family)